jgi:hypothetical protein
MEATRRNPAPSAPAAHPFTPRPFHAARWLRGPHAQTVAGRYLRPRTGVHYRRERVDTPDGDFIDLDWATVHGRPAPPDDAPLVLVLHGLETCRKLWDRGIRSVSMNFRSCSGEPNRLARFYHAGDTGDIAHVLDLLAARFPGVALAGIGFSLGANVLLKYLGERGTDALLRAAAAVSIPFDLAAGADKLAETAMGRLYTLAFVRPLMRKYRQKRHLIGGEIDERRAAAARTFREFDEVVTARLHGFDGAADYYGRSSSGQFLPRIRVPTLLVHAADDPFVPPDAIPHDTIAANPALVAALTEQGGHVGFIAGAPWKPEFWAEAEAARFVAEELGSSPFPALSTGG